MGEIDDAAAVVAVVGAAVAVVVGAMQVEESPSRCKCTWWVQVQV